MTASGPITRCCSRWPRRASRCGRSTAPATPPARTGPPKPGGEVLPRVARHFGTVYVRGDSKFYERDVLAQCVRHGAFFAIRVGGFAVLRQMAEKLPESAWIPFTAPDRDELAKVAAAAGRKERRKRARQRRRIAREREYKTLSTTSEWTAEFHYTIPPNAKEEKKPGSVSGRSYRMAVKRQLVEETQGQKTLTTEYRYLFVISNIPSDQMDVSEVLGFAFDRCDQENFIEQFKNGIAALRMPTGELLANSAFLMAGQLAWCLRSWLSLLALPPATIRWEWKWFRQAFVYVAARVTSSARRAVTYLMAAHRFVEHLLIASQRLQSFVFR